MSTHLLLHEEFQPQQAFQHHATTLVIMKLQVWDLRVQAQVQWHLHSERLQTSVSIPSHKGNPHAMILLFESARQCS